MTVSQSLPRNRGFWDSKRVKLDYSTETSCDNRLLETTCAASAYFVKSGFSMDSIPSTQPSMTMARSRAMGALGGKRTVAALNDTMLAPAPDGAFGPVPRGVAVGRPRRACAYGEQTGHHGKGKNKRKQFSFHRFFFPSENLFLRLPAVGSQGQFCPRQGNFLAYHTEDTQKSNMLAAHHLPEIPRS